VRAFTYYNGSDWVSWLPQVDFAYNTSHALGIEHTPFEANYCSSPKEPLDLLLPMRPSIPISTATNEQLQQLRKVHELVTYALQVHTYDMQACSQPSTAPQLRPRDKVSVVRKAFFYAVNSA
jgi:hypothetical protein